MRIITRVASCDMLQKVVLLSTAATYNSGNTLNYTFQLAMQQHAMFRDKLNENVARITRCIVTKDLFAAARCLLSRDNSQKGIVGLFSSSLNNFTVLEFNFFYSVYIGM